MDDVAATLARLEVSRLDERIDGARRLLASNAEMTDQERGRFLAYIARLQDRRAEIEAAMDPGRRARTTNGSDGSDEDVVMTEARVNNLESTLRHMDERLSRIVDQIHQLDNRQQRSEDRLQRMETELINVQTQLHNLVSTPGYSRIWLAGGALAMTVVVALLVLLTWRLL